ncbi:MULTISPECIES: gliding motility lipoprotein GldD [unclassified Saccharicrinis]|uniref:gliding motility lipoprotein GldD n=1 Tax=unclassified Saccharicrinis TaxID=2646859 RepID=UPI003D331977
MKNIVLILGLTSILAVFSCKHHGTPKPRAYYRITFPKHEYQPLNKECPFSFDVPVYTQILDDDRSHNAEKYWYNMDYPTLNGTVHISYKAVDNNLNEMLEDSRKLAYKHAVKADAIGERIFVGEEKKVYGTLYEIMGDAASSVQFYLTDSTHHFVRGSLYFNAVPNKDSLAPVIDFVKEDIFHLMETFEWKEMPNF